MSTLLSGRPRRRSSVSVARSGSGRQRSRRRRHLLEMLEDRRLLATIEVTTGLDVVDSGDGLTSLREAIDQANANSDLDTITFRGGVNVISLTKTTGSDVANNNVNGDLDLSNGEIIIQGNGRDLTVIDAGGDTGFGERAVQVVGGAVVTIKDLTIRGGRDSGGGGVSSAGNSSSSLTLDNVLLTDNESTGTGGAILVTTEATVNLIGSTVEGNTASASGGGIVNFGTLTVEGSTIRGNQAGNLGGGILVRGDVDNPASATVTASTLSGNTATAGGGGFANFNGTADLSNTTISGNSTPGFAGAVLNVTDGPGLIANTEIIHSTLTLNQSGGTGNVHTLSQNNATGATIDFGNSIFVSNRASGTAKNLTIGTNNGGTGSTFNSLGNNLLDDADAFGVLVASDISEFDVVATPVISSTLADNGGSTLTHALIDDSANPAINGGNNALASLLPFDQRQSPFPRQVGFAVDIGALELITFDAADFVVTSIDDDGFDLLDFDVTLREAILASNVTPGAQEITFASFLTASAPATIGMNGTEMLITDSVTITGPGADRLTIDGDGRSRIFTIDDGDDQNQIDVTLTGLTLTGGQTALTGDLSKTGGGAISTVENLTITDSVITGNSAGFLGGGISSFNRNSSLTLVRSTLSGNSAGRGGAITSNGPLAIHQSTISGNTSASFGSAVYGGGFNRGLITGSTIAGNIGPQAIFSDGEVTLHSTIVAGNRTSGGTLNNITNRVEAASANNLIGAGDNGGLTDGSNGNLVGVDWTRVLENDGTDPMLADNGGSTPTIAPLVDPSNPGRDAINAGSNPNGETNDQRRFPFRRDDGGGVDIGAVELQRLGSPSFVVTTLDDVVDSTDGEISLREAIEFSTHSPGAEVITFDPGLFVGGPATLTIALGQFLITDDLTIAGPSAKRLTIHGNFESRIFKVDDGNAASDIDVTLSGLTLTGGFSTDASGFTEGSGGAIHTVEDLTVQASTISGNFVQGTAFGGGIFAGGNGTLTVKDSTISGNTAYSGGGLINYTAGGVVISGSTISGNQAVNYAGGGIFNQNDLTISNSTITNNVTPSFGGGIHTRFTNTVTIHSSIIAGNRTAVGDPEDLRRFTSTLQAKNSLFGVPVNTTLVDGVDGNQIGVADAGLEPLADNGGPTATHALAADSPALNAGAVISELVTNGGFETGDFTGWTTQTSSASGIIEINDGTVDTSGFAADPFAPISGNFDAVLHTTNVSSRELSQPILVPPDVINATLTWSDRIFNADVFSDPNQEYRVVVEDTLGNRLQEIFSTNPGDAVSQPGPNPRSFDITSLLQNHLGETLILKFESQDDSGFFSVWIDDVALQVESTMTTVGHDQRGIPFGRDDGGGVDIGSYERQSLASSFFVVTTTADELDFSDSDVSLREAIESANGSIGTDAITFDSNLLGQTIQLEHGELSIVDDVSIEAGAREAITIDAGGNSRVLNAGFSDIDLQLSGLVITGGATGSFGSGGGVRFASLGTLTISDSKITGNSAASNGGGVYSRSDLTVTGSTISGNTAGFEGGGIRIGMPANEVTVSDSTISQNEARFGGGISADTVSITNSTISGNTASSRGGGVFSYYGSTTISHSTVTANRAVNEGGGLRVSNSQIILHHTIVAQNLSDGGEVDVSGEIDPVSSFNLIGIDTGSSGINSGAAGNHLGTAASPIDPMLGPLADNGGPTETHALLTGSPAIDAGDENFDASGLPNDQRRSGFPRVADGDVNGTTIIDIGAFELLGINQQPTFTASNPPAVLEDSGAHSLSFATFDAGDPGESHQNVVAYTVSNIADPTLFSSAPGIDNSGNLSYTVAADAFGTSTFDVTVQDDGGTSNGGVDTSTVQRFTITINGVNDAPTFTASNPPAVEENSGAQSEPGFVTSFTAGPANESGQSVVAYTVSAVSNPSLFSAGPSVDSAGNLTYTPAADVFGTSTFDLRVQDDGGTDRGGVDTSAPQTFTITVSQDQVPDEDFGDAPAQYPVTFAQNGARHTVGPLRLGAAIDAELDGQPSAGADGDGNDDDGVIAISDIVVAAGVQTTASFQVVTTAAGRLDAWIDFVGDGWDVGDQIAADVPVNAGSNTLSFTVPTNSVSGTAAARFRLSTAGGLSPVGAAADGEVEDYLVTILNGGTAPEADVRLVGNTASVDSDGSAVTVDDTTVNLFQAPVASVGKVSVHGTAGDDSISVDYSDSRTNPSGGIEIDGLGGDNTLQIRGDSGNIDLTGSGTLHVQNFSSIDLGDDANANIITIDAATVGALSPSAKSVIISGGQGDAIVFDDADDWIMGPTSISNNTFVRSVVKTPLDGGTETIQATLPSPWQNLVRVSDVNNNGDITAGDALVVINELGRRLFSNRASEFLVDPLTVQDWPGIYYDQNGDGKATALDALRVINEVGRISLGGGEAEAATVDRVIGELLRESEQENARLPETPLGPFVQRGRQAASFDTVASVGERSMQESLALSQADDQEQRRRAVDELLSETQFAASENL